jgi:hypothetical protein
MASLQGSDGNNKWHPDADNMGSAKTKRKKMVRKLWWFTFLMLTMGSLLIMIRGAMLAI